MSIQLLDKTRRINKVLHNNHSNTVNFGDIADALSEGLHSNVMVFSRKGKLLGTGLDPSVMNLAEFKELKIGNCLDKVINERFLNILSTKENVNLMTLGFEQEEDAKILAIICPIDVAGERLGTLFIYRLDQEYTIDDIILSEYGTTVVGLEILRAVNEETEEEERNLRNVRSAIATLSYSELHATIQVFQRMKKNEGLLVASKIADQIGITRSVIVNALRKLESAGVIETRSSGMKGTHIKILNQQLINELNKIEK